MSQLETIFPGLTHGHYRITSPQTPRYNCIAWAAEDTNSWWWPVPKKFFQLGYHWPEEVPRKETLPAFVAAYESLGYEKCDTSEHEEGFQRVAIFSDEHDKPTHAARQLENGYWTSKCGKLEDIEHELSLLEGERYGTVACIMKKSI